MRRFASPKHLEQLRLKARKRRQKQGHPPTVFYFHQVDDPYSHLAVQKLDQLRRRYDLVFQPYLVSGPKPQYQGSRDHFQRWGLRDAVSVATDYGTEFSPTTDTIDTDDLKAANQVLASHLREDDFAQTAVAVGTAVWRQKSLSSRIQASGEGEQAVTAGNAKRTKLGHYQGAMFYFDGEWFWGVDRLRLLEARLHAEGFDTEGSRHDARPSVPQPKPEHTQPSDNVDDILLEYYPSLRSPYTAIGQQRVLDLVQQTGVKTNVRPVMPMLMRGIPAPREKQRYIITDAGREGRANGVPFGEIVDPFGDPVMRAFSLFPAADAMGHGMAFVTAYLNAAWFDGIDITKEKGLRVVIANAGLDWQAIKDASQALNWERQLSDNLAALTQENLWGVPSFRVSGGNNQEPYSCWGQDRIWRVATEISRRAK